MYVFIISFLVYISSIPTPKENKAEKENSGLPPQNFRKGILALRS